MKQDVELVEFVRQAYSHPVSDEQARTARMQIVHGIALTGIVLLAAGYYQWSRHPGLTSLLPLVVSSLLLGWNQVVHYRVARPRQATPIPDDVLAWAVKLHARCRACKAIVRRDVLLCPSCGVLLAIGPGFWVALAVGLTALATLVWWNLP